MVNRKYGSGVWRTFPCLTKWSSMDRLYIPNDILFTAVIINTKKLFAESVCWAEGKTFPNRLSSQRRTVIGDQYSSGRTMFYASADWATCADLLFALPQLYSVLVALPWGGVNPASSGQSSVQVSSTWPNSPYFRVNVNNDAEFLQNLQAAKPSIPHSIKHTHCTCYGMLKCVMSCTWTPFCSCLR